MDYGWLILHIDFMMIWRNTGLPHNQTFCGIILSIRVFFLKEPSPFCILSGSISSFLRDFLLFSLGISLLLKTSRNISCLSFGAGKCHLASSSLSMLLYMSERPSFERLSNILLWIWHICLSMPLWMVLGLLCLLVLWALLLECCSYPFLRHILFLF